MTLGLKEKSGDPAELAAVALARPCGDVLPQTLGFEIRDGAGEAGSVGQGPRAHAGFGYDRHDGSNMATALVELAHGGGILKVDHRNMQYYCTSLACSQMAEVSSISKLDALLKSRPTHKMCHEHEHSPKVNFNKCDRCQVRTCLWVAVSTYGSEHSPSSLA